MSFVVKFYRTNSEDIDTNKNLTHVIDKNIVLKEDIDILNPIIKLSQRINTNYAYIPEYGRYYFVKISDLTGGLFQYTLNVDVAQTFANSIKNTTCTVLRNENLSNAYLHDSEYRTLAYKKYVTKSFPRGLTHDSIILNCIGGRN